MINEVNCPNGLCLDTELVDGDLMVSVARFQDARGEMAFIGGVGEMLCFKADGATGGEGGSVCTFETIVLVGRIDLYPRFRRIYFQ